jgi:hypothetical protein
MTADGRGKRPFRPRGWGPVNRMDHSVQSWRDCHRLIVGTVVDIMQREIQLARIETQVAFGRAGH